LLCINNKNIDPFFNLAAEEYLLSNLSEDCFMVWQNSPSVIIGKHQNALAEINYPFIKENNIIVARRLSGGGAVYHDLGNLNFTFVMKCHDKNKMNFKIFTDVIIGFLEELSIYTYLNNRNDILIDNKKISGTAAHIHNNKILFHGTLLYTSDLSNIYRSLDAGNNYFGKSVKSNKTTVTKIIEYLRIPLTAEILIDTLLFYIHSVFPECLSYDFNDIEIAEINDLASKKYNKWEWIYGYSPNYKFQKSTIIDNKNLDLNIDVSNGVITDINLTGNFFKSSAKVEIEKSLNGIRHKEEEIFKLVDKFVDFDKVAKIELIKAFF
jgi:lipoate---protein ligase